METVRAFVAIELNDALHAALARLERGLKEGAALPVRWVEPHAIHLTLKFLGDVAAERLPEVQRGLARATVGVQPFSIALGGLGGFPTLARPRVLWIGLEGEVETLARLQRRVEQEMEALGFPPEERPFQPHLTLARVRQGGGRLAWDPSQVQAAGQPPGVAQAIEGVSLMRSDLRPAGAVYTRLAAFPLG